jgi:hypothetical protein
MLFMICCLLILFSVPTFAQSSDVPPIAFSSTWDHYTLVDVETFEMTDIPRDGSMGLNETNGFEMPPHRIPMRAPAAYIGKLMLVDDSDPETGGTVEGGYSLYLENSETDREFIMNGLSLFVSATSWSTDGRYVYLNTTLDAHVPRELYRYDAQTQTLEFMIDNVWLFPRGCQRYTPHCIVMHGDDETFTSGTVYYMNRDTGDMSPIRVGPLVQRPFAWQAQAPIVTYHAKTADSTIIYSFDVESQQETELVTLPADVDIQRAELAPDGRYLFTHVYDAETASELYVYDLTTPDADPIHVTAGFDELFRNGQHTPQWIDADTLAFDGRYQDGIAGFYLFHVPDGTLQHINTDNASTYDQAWSPDGRWFAYVTSNYELYAVATTPDAEPFKVADEASCVGWLPEAIATSGQAHLCDKYWGMG